MSRRDNPVLAKLVQSINTHIEKHKNAAYPPPPETCVSLAEEVRSALPQLMKQSLCSSSRLTHTSQMCMFLIMLLGNADIAFCNTLHALLEGETPPSRDMLLAFVRALYQLLPLPKFAYLHERLSLTIGSLLGQLVPVEPGLLVSFSEACVSLVQDLHLLHKVLSDPTASAGDAVITAFAGVLGDEGLQLPLPTPAYVVHALTCTTAIIPEVVKRVVQYFSGRDTYATLWGQVITSIEMHGDLEEPLNRLALLRASLECVVQLVAISPPPAVVQSHVSSLLPAVASELLAVEIEQLQGSYGRKTFQSVCSLLEKAARALTCSSSVMDPQEPLLPVLVWWERQALQLAGISTAQVRIARDLCHMAGSLGEKAAAGSLIAVPCIQCQVVRALWKLLGDLPPKTLEQVLRGEIEEDVWFERPAKRCKLSFAEPAAHEADESELATREAEIGPRKAGGGEETKGDAMVDDMVVAASGTEMKEEGYPYSSTSGNGTSSGRLTVLRSVFGRAQGALKAVKQLRGKSLLVVLDGGTPAVATTADILELCATCTGALAAVLPFVRDGEEQAPVLNSLAAGFSELVRLFAAKPLKTLEAATTNGTCLCWAWHMLVDCSLSVLYFLPQTDPSSAEASVMTSVRQLASASLELIAKSCPALVENDNLVQEPWGDRPPVADLRAASLLWEVDGGADHGVLHAAQALPLLERCLMLASCLPAVALQVAPALENPSDAVRLAAAGVLPTAMETCGLGTPPHDGSLACMNWDVTWQPALASSIKGDCEAVRQVLAKTVLLQCSRVIDQAETMSRVASNHQNMSPLKLLGLRLEPLATCLPRLQLQRQSQEAPGLSHSHNTFSLLLPLLAAIAQGSSSLVVASGVQLALRVLEEATLEDLLETSGQGRAILRWLLESLWSSEPEVTYLASRQAGVLVMSEAKLLRALFTGEGEATPDPQTAAERFCKELDEQMEKYGDHPDRLEVEGAVEIQSLLRAVGAIGCQVDPKEPYGMYLLQWVLCKLIRTWTEKDGPFHSRCFDELMRICLHGRVPLPELLKVGDFDTMELLPPVVETLLLGGLLAEFVEQVLGNTQVLEFLQDRLCILLPAFVSNKREAALESLASLIDGLKEGELTDKKSPSQSLVAVLLNDNMRVSSHLLKHLLMGCKRAAREKQVDDLEFLLSFFPGNKLSQLILHVRLLGLLSELAWELSGDMQESAVHAIKIVAYYATMGEDKEDKDTFRPGEKLEGVERSVEKFITKHFLYLMSNLVFRDWMARSAKDKVRALKVLAKLVGMIAKADIAMFVPKVMATLNAALADPHATPQVKSTAYTTMCTFIKVQPEAVLADNLSTIVVNLLPALEMEPAEGNARELVIELLHDLIVKRRQELKAHFHTVPFVPALPELTRVNKVLDLEVGQPLLAEQLQQLVGMLENQSSQVRLIALKHLMGVLSNNRAELRPLVERAGNQDSVICALLRSLLRICSADGSSPVRDACARCLGELGAIDFSRLHQLSLAGNGSKGKQVASWFMSLPDMCLDLLQYQLVPAFRAAGSSIDRVAFGIQELLAVMGRCDYGTAEGKTTPKGGSKTKGTKRKCSPAQVDEAKGPMPEELVCKLQDRGLMEAVEPFWTTRYILRDRMGTPTPPFFNSPAGRSLDRWLASWCHHLIKRASGPMAEVFQACGGAVRSHSGTAHFLLPHLCLDAIVFGSDDDRKNILDEIMAVCDGQVGRPAGGAGAANSKSATSFVDMAAQAVFALFDTLSMWASLAGQQKPHQPSHKGWPKDKLRRRSTRHFLRRIPRPDLVKAAMRIKAYTRALQLFEQQIRDQQVVAEHGLSQGQTQPQSQACGGSDGTLKLCESGLSQLQSIYRMLPDEPDGMPGLEVVRRVSGVPGTLVERIWLHEHAEEWGDALQLYEQALQEQRAVGDAELATGSELKGGWDEGELEAGMLHSMMEMGHLESVLHQVYGVLAAPASKVVERKLLPLAVEAGWKLQRWPLLHEWLGGPFNVSNDFGEGTYHMTLGLAMLKMAERDEDGFNLALEQARAHVMASLGAASMESYQRAYPFLLRLHSLRELEQGFSLLANDDEDKREALAGWDWDGRLEAMTAHLRHQAPVLAVRQAVLREAGMDDEAAGIWLRLTKGAMVAGRFSMASYALRKAGALGIPAAKMAMQEAKVVHAQGQVQRALLLLGPVETDAQQAMMPKPGSKGFAESEKNYAAKKLLLTTNWIAEAGQAQGSEVIDRYKMAVSLRPGWEKGFFGLGQYSDLLFRKRAEFLQQQGGGTQRGSKNSKRPLASDEVTHTYAYMAIDNYLKSVKHGDKTIFQSLPRLLTLWFEINSLAASTASGKGKQSSSKSKGSAAGTAVVQKLQAKSNKLIKQSINKVPAYKWYTCLPQLMSRVKQQNEEVLGTIVAILAAVLTQYPHQAVWMLSGLAMSINSERQTVGARIFHEGREKLLKAGRKEDADSIKDAASLFKELIQLAAHTPSYERAREDTVSIGRRLKVDRFLIPLQKSLKVSLPGSMACKKQRDPKANAAKGEEDDIGSHKLFPTEDQLHIKKIEERVEIMQSKAKPKKMGMRALETGKVFYFLCKQERNGDLRKDARLMEFNQIVNRMLEMDTEGRVRKLQLRTYSVVCLNEECGVLEWVENTVPYRTLLDEARKLHRGLTSKVPDLRTIAPVIEEIQRIDTLEHMAEAYKQRILTQYPPCFSYWIHEQFSDSSAWLEARTLFTRSAAVWSAVGHIVGLGDRHCENILIDTTVGECVHVDYDCLFDKGTMLRRPEIVPFRLTPSMVDGMGLTGYEGVFRRTMECTMKVLRENRETLLSVLEPFLFDPTVGWRRGGRAQRERDESAAGGKKDLGQDEDNPDALRILRVIDERLTGYFKTSFPASVKLDRSKTKELEGFQLPLSVQGQVHRLIHEATAVNNLCQMWMGWQPWN